jgi:lysophospholipase L1-like esterase
MKIMAALILMICILGCEKGTTNGMITTDSTKTDTTAGQLSYLALGDSYTIGEAVAQEQSFPYQLSANLNAQAIKVATPFIVARTGWTTDELQSAINSAALKPKYDIVTLLIGVNNQYRGYPIDAYRTEFRALLQRALAFAGGIKSHVFVVSIPDWGLTPFGKNSGRDVKKVSEQINAFNTVNKEETINVGISYTDITPSSRKVDTDVSLAASDGLHPSGKMYQEWVTLLAPSVAKNYK